MKNIEKLVTEAKAMRSNGHSIERTLSNLRKQGASIVDSVKIVRAIEEVPLGQAKAIVDQSDAWADHLKDNKRIRLVGENALLKISPDE